MRCEKGSHRWDFVVSVPVFKRLVGFARELGATIFASRTGSAANDKGAGGTLQFARNGIPKKNCGAAITLFRVRGGHCALVLR